jgi:hypothetical protein
MEHSPDATHQHVGWVRLMDGTVLSRAQVLAYMRQGIVFYTHASNGSQAKVAPYQCRRCTQTYLRTEQDLSKADNLDELPPF